MLLHICLLHTFEYYIKNIHLLKGEKHFFKA